jgi:NAD(P)-dependent dehydrogenase (short-subunit alcohol dehydrogenase family)
VTDPFRVDGKVAVVTGASSGLGVACAEVLGRAGARVVLAARRVERLEAVAADLAAAGVEVVPVACDVARRVDCDGVVAAAVETFGAVDLLVNNAGVAGGAPASRETEEHFRSILDVNLMGAYWMAQACGRVMPPGSAIVNVSSVLALTTGGLPQAAYTASKAGLLGLTRDLAQQWADRKGIRVNAVAPGFFATEMTEEYEPGYLDEMVERRIPARRLGRLDECANTILFLVSPASSYVNGVTLPVDGGLLLT